MWNFRENSQCKDLEVRLPDLFTVYKQAGIVKKKVRRIRGEGEVREGTSGIRTMQDL